MPERLGFLFRHIYKIYSPGAPDDGAHFLKLPHHVTVLSDCDQTDGNEFWRATAQGLSPITLKEFLTFVKR